MSIELFRKFGLHASANALAYREGKTCRTCAHLDSDARAEPCTTCVGFERWEARSTAGVPAARQAERFEAVGTFMEDGGRWLKMDASYANDPDTVTLYRRTDGVPEAPAPQPVAYHDKDQPHGIAWCPGYPEGLKDITPLYADGVAGTQADERMRHDYPILQQFHSKHALGALAAPSCLCCGRQTGPDRPIAVQHMELPAIVICKQCKDAASGVAPSQPEQPAWLRCEFCHQLGCRNPLAAGVGVAPHQTFCSKPPTT